MFEYATALCYLLAAGLFTVQPFRRKVTIQKLVGAANPNGNCDAGAPNMLACFLYAGLYLFVSGEEVSWGQRLLGFQTPVGLEQISVKSEMTVHNIRGLHTTSRLIGVLACLWICLVLPLAARWNRPIGDFAGRRSIPLFPLWINGVVFAAIGVMVYPRVVWGSISQNLDELGECILGLAFLIFAVELHLKAHTRSRSLKGPIPVDGRLGAALGAAETAV